MAAALALGMCTVSAEAQAPTAHPTLSAHPHVYRSSLTKAQIAQYAKSPNRRVVVLLRNQLPQSVGGGNNGLRARAAQLARSQRAIHTELARLHAPGLRSYHFINALSAHVSKLEANRLAHNPQVLAVVPDRKVTLPAGTDTTAAHPSAAPRSAPVNRTPGLCGTANKPLQEPEALGQIRANHVGNINGKGVRIAVFPDGLAPNIKDFRRRDGSHAIFDYKDFTGDGPNGVTFGGEAFGDASSIIAQSRVTYDLSKVVNTNLPLPSPCDIRVKGVAPGASLAVMKVFGTGSSYDSLILQGMDYAVSHDHVNVLSESFGGNPLPNPATDPEAVFNALAVQHGITVVASSGDAGINNTIGTPASSSAGIISAGATTSFRSHAQLSQHGYQLGGYKGWLDNNIATLSSGGFTDYGPNSVDLVAPGDGNWASCSRNINEFLDCANPYGGSSAAPGTFVFGGTSEACPLIAATAALVIQAYRGAHGGNTPSPSVVKQILTGTARDLDMPVNEQGAGQVNAQHAVQLARSYGLSERHGTNVSFSPTKIEKTGPAGSAHSRTITVRNSGTEARTIRPVYQQFTAPRTIAMNTVTYAPASPSTPTFTYWLDGKPEPYVEQDFTVPAGYQRLNVRFGYPQDQTKGQEVFEVLFDPRGKLAQDSDPQGAPLGFGQGDVRNPRAGKWRAIFFSRPGSNPYSGPITMQAQVQKRVRSKFGSISPASRRLAPGASGSFTLTYPTPAKPSDAASEVNFGSGIGVLPVLTRGVAQTTAQRPSTFTGELTTGNGRQVLPSQELPFEFHVPRGVKDVDVDVHVADAGYTLLGLLNGPNKQPVESTTTLFYNLATGTETATQDLHLSWRNPVPGRWEVDLASIGGTSSGKVATTVTGTIAFDKVDVTATGVPHSAGTKLPAGTPVTAQVTVHNTGNSSRQYFIDPRRAGQSTYSLGWLNDPNGTLPVSPSAVPQVIVPPDTSSMTMVARATKPSVFSTSPAFGTPEVLSTSGRTPVATISGRELSASEWACPLTIIGPFPTATNGGSFSCAAFGTTDTIDDSVAAQGGNLWDSFTDPNSPNQFDPTQSVVVPPGGSTTIAVQINPSQNDVGNTVRGFLEVQSFDAETFSGDSLKKIPYEYTVTAPPA